MAHIVFNYCLSHIFYIHLESSRRSLSAGSSRLSTISQNRSRGKAVAVKILTKGRRSDFDELKKSSLCEADLMYKLLGTVCINIYIVLY